MNNAVLIGNIEKLCFYKSISIAVALRESKAGKDFIGHLNRGSSPSVEKVQMLAQYLGVTTSELLGEPIRGRAALPPDAEEVARAYLSRSTEVKNVVRASLGLAAIPEQKVKQDKVLNFSDYKK